MLWAEAVATEVISVVTVMPLTSMPLTPRLKPWRWINKAKDSAESCAHDSPYALSLNTFGGGRKYDLRVPGPRSRRKPASSLLDQSQRSPASPAGAVRRRARVHFQGWRRDR